MKKNVIITAGGTEEAIDNVRKITNVSSGKLGSMICNTLLENKESDIEKIFYLCPKSAVRPIDNEKIEFVFIKSVNDLKERVEELLKNNRIDLFIHSMAVSDYTVDYVTNASMLSKYIEESGSNNVRELILNNKNVFDMNGKISSTEKDLIIKLKPTPKVISLIKEFSPDTFLVGFKLLDNVEENELINVAINLKDKNKCDLVVANDLTNIKFGVHKTFIIDKENKIISANGKEEIAKKLVSRIFND